MAGSATAFTAPDPGYESKVRDSFARQPAMALIGAEMKRVEPGLVELELRHRDDLTQQHGYLHAGITTAAADTAGGYAAFTLMPAGSSVLSAEFKVNLVAPADGRTFIAFGRVVRPGGRLFTCEIGVDVVHEGERRACLVGLQTVVCLRNREDAPAERVAER